MPTKSALRTGCEFRQKAGLALEIAAALLRIDARRYRQIVSVGAAADHYVAGMIQGDSGGAGQAKPSDTCASHASDARAAKIGREDDLLAVRTDFGEIGIIRS